MSTLKKDHILGAGTGALAAGATGAAIGAVVAGPPGLVVGAVAGGALGAVLGDRAAEAADRREDLGHFEQIYREMPYYVDGMKWEDYAPAYRYGLETYRVRGGQPFTEAEPQLEAAGAAPGTTRAWPGCTRAARSSTPGARSTRRCTRKGRSANRRRVGAIAHRSQSTSVRWARKSCPPCVRPRRAPVRERDA